MDRLTDRMGELLVNQNRKNLNHGRIPNFDERRNPFTGGHDNDDYEYINDYDDYYRNLILEEDNDDSVKPITGAAFPPSIHHYLGAIRSAITLTNLHIQNQNDIGFTDFQQKLSNFLTGFLPVYGIDVPLNVKYPIQLLSHEKVSKIIALLIENNINLLSADNPILFSQNQL